MESITCWVILSSNNARHALPSASSAITWVRRGTQQRYRVGKASRPRKAITSFELVRYRVICRNLISFRQALFKIQTDKNINKLQHTPCFLPAPLASPRGLLCSSIWEGTRRLLNKAFWTRTVCTGYNKFIPPIIELLFCIIPHNCVECSQLERIIESCHDTFEFLMCTTEFNPCL